MSVAFQATLNVGEFELHVLYGLFSLQIIPKPKNSWHSSSSVLGSDEKLVKVPHCELALYTIATSQQLQDRAVARPNRFNWELM